ncbi:MAG TPA: hypothetical protein VG710_14465, partial [Opitutus sp.]|nr:hypothetical protein [Opitutus sp.]
SASGAASYRWAHDGRTITGAAGGTFALPAATMADGGFYQAFVTNTAGTTASALIYVRVAPAITTVVAWGDSSAALTSVPANLENAVAIAPGYSHVLAVTRDGYVRGWGSNSVGETAIPAGLDSVVGVAAGYYDSLALKADGTLAAWGYNASGQASIPPGLGNVVAIAGGYAHFLALKADGTVVAWGDNTYGQTQVPAGLSGVVAIGAGRNHSLAVKSDGTVVAWGAATSGQTAVPSNLGNAIAVSGGAEHSLALKSDGTVAQWGYNPFGALTTGNGSVTVIAAGYYHSLALLTNGTVTAWGYNNSGETVVPAGLGRVFAIAAGNYCSFAIREASQTALAAAPVVAAQPVAETVNAGETATFQAAFTGSPAPTLQWQASIDRGVTWTNLSDGGVYAGTSTGTLQVIGATVAMSGEQLRCVGTNSGGSAISTAATLTVQALNTAPTISGVANQTLVANGTTGPLAFTIGDAETAAANLTLGGTSSNATLVPNGNIVFGGSGSSRTVTVTPAANQAGSAVITLSVSDGELAATSAFVVTVTKPNAAPTITNIANQSITQGGSTAALPFTVGDAETPAGSLVVTVGSSNQTLAPDAGIVLGGSGANRTIKITPAAGETGTAVVTVVVSDGQLSASAAFILTVAAVNQPPQISAVANQTILVSTFTESLAFVISDAETPAAKLTLAVATSNAGLVPLANIAVGGTDANRTVTVTPKPKSTGVATVTLQVGDGAATATTSFTVRVVTSNNAFADAVTLNGLSDEATGSNVGANKELREPNHAGDRGGHSVWWEWTAPETGPVLISTDGSNFRTLLAVYTGASVDALHTVASSANSSGALGNDVLFGAVAGTTYEIAVDGYRGATGSIVLDVVQGPAAQ